MTTDTTAWSELGKLRESLQTDSADLKVTNFEAGVLRVRLVLGDPTCAECIMDKAMLELLIGRAVAAHSPAVIEVHLDDPRLAASA